MVTAEPIDAAVIDVGSNSVRLVVYRLEGRAIWTVYNEKLLAGLGRDLPQTGRLSPDGVEKAMVALSRFAALLGAKKGDHLFAVATAAVREATDGPEFLNRVKDETGFRLRVLSGKEEARYSALGVAASTPDATGVVGDLGGGSLELVRIDKGKPGKGETFAVGPFALIQSGARSPAEVEAEVKKRLKNAAPFAADTLHAVGGAWRNIANIHMMATGYPLEIVQQYQMTAEEALDTARFVARQSRGSLERMGGASRKRAETLPYAAAVMAAVVEKLAIKDVVISAYGLREGLLFESMPHKVRAQDPLRVGLAALARRPADAEALGAALDKWLSPAFATLPPVLGERDAAVVSAACRLAELGARLHPDHRASLAYEQILRAPVAGQNHAERAFLAITVFSRHTAVGELDDAAALSRLLDFQGQRRARALGAAIRLGCDLSGRNPKLLAASKLTFTDEAVILEAHSKKANLLLGDQNRRRAEMLARTLGRNLVIQTT
jgi:exopolyphosphatase/guanosine-5'-triphosphate,3'-diphosphate pyrophosphatase